jgi:hypothetical protein
MISHIRDEGANVSGFERLGSHVVTGGTLLLGVQPPHTDYTVKVSNGMEYSQQLMDIDSGFRKEYRLSEGGRTVMEQTTDYRTYSFDDALELLDKSGFEFTPRPDDAAPLFLEFTRR